jgi:hypothetical protein
MRVPTPTIFLSNYHRHWRKFSYKIGFDKERNGISQSNTQEKYQYFLETVYNIAEWLDLAATYSYEEINNYENVKDGKQKNHFIGCRCAFTF